MGLRVGGACCSSDLTLSSSASRSLTWGDASGQALLSYCITKCGSGDTPPCKVTLFILHGVISPEWMFCFRNTTRFGKCFGYHLLAPRQWRRAFFQVSGFGFLVYFG